MFRETWREESERDSFMKQHLAKSNYEEFYRFLKFDLKTSHCEC